MATKSTDHSNISLSPENCEMTNLTGDEILSIDISIPN